MSRVEKSDRERCPFFKIIHLRSKDQLHKLFAKMRGNTTKSDKIEKFIFEIKDVDSAEIDILCDVFFNVRELIFYERIHNVKDLRFTKILSSHPWSKTIKRFTEASSRLFTDCILRGGLYPLLTEITISGQKKLPRRRIHWFTGKCSRIKGLSTLELQHDFGKFGIIVQKSSLVFLTFTQ